MQQKLKIFLAFSEVAPFIKTGGVGDVGGALPKYLKEQGHDVRVITPQYRDINERRYILRDVIRLQDIEIPLGDEVVTVNVKSAFLPQSKVQVYFLDYKPYFFRKGIYQHPETGNPYDDNAQRFILFSLGVLETLKKLQWQPDIIHCNDWQTALIPFLLRTSYQEDPFFQPVSSLLTIHDFEAQGVFPASDVNVLSLEEACQNVLTGKDHKINFLKTGMMYANYINTVNQEQYQKFLEAKDGSDLANVIQGRENLVVNIDDGIDEMVWNPATDGLIENAFSKEDRDGKIENKRAFLENISLPFHEEKPLIVLPVPVLNEKEKDLLQSVVSEILKFDANLVLVADHKNPILKKYKPLQKTHSKQLAIAMDPHEKQSHQSLAAADILFFPFHRQEVLHLAMFAMQYGTLPVVSHMVGIEQIISPCDAKEGTGNGFIFSGQSVKNIASCLKNALKLYQSAKWPLFVGNAMEQNLSWTEPAESYWKLYQKCVTDQRKQTKKI